MIRWGWSGIPVVPCPSNNQAKPAELSSSSSACPSAQIRGKQPLCCPLPPSAWPPGAQAIPIWHCQLTASSSPMSKCWSLRTHLADRSISLPPSRPESPTPHCRSWRKESGSQSWTPSSPLFLLFSRVSPPSKRHSEVSWSPRSTAAPL